MLGEILTGLDAVADAGGNNIGIVRIERRPDAGNAVCEGVHHGRGGKQNIQHDDDAVLEMSRQQIFFLQQNLQIGHECG